MKTAIFIKEDRQQVVLTPENEWERKICKMIEEDKKTLNVYYGQFVDVEGGWTMHNTTQYRGEDEDSLIIVLDKKTK